MGLKIKFMFLLFVYFWSICDCTNVDVDRHQPCHRGFLQIGTKCYKYTSLSRKTNAQARSVCRSLDSNLADIRTSRDRGNIVKLIQRYGFRQESYWVAVSDANLIEEDEEGRNEGGDVCIVISPRPAFRIVRSSCINRHLFVCQHSVESPVSERIADDENSCAGRYGYFPHPSDCRRYILCYNSQKFTYRCSRNTAYVESVSRCVPDAEFAGSTVPGEEEKGNCGSYDVDDLELQVTGGAEGGGGARGGGEEATTVEDDLQCEPGYKKHRSKCYKFDRSYVQWGVANRTCVETENAKLVTIPSHNFMKFISKTIRKMHCVKRKCEVHDYWIGLNDKATPETFVWSDGTILMDDQYNNWSRRAGKRYPSIKQCVKLSSIYKWQWMDATCNEEGGYICEKDAIPAMQQPHSDCGRFHTTGVPRVEAIIGGTHANGRTHPWQVSLRYNSEHKCGGSLIDQCWIMTAAHCVTLPNVPPEEEPSEAVLGDFDFLTEEEGEETLRFTRIYVHPGWVSFPVPTNDIALIKLSQCSQHHNPICLPTSREYSFPTGTECNIAGYGTVNPDRRVYPNALIEAAVPLLDARTCESLYVNPRRQRQTYISEQMFCAGYLEGGVDSCQGDSGGPLSCRDQVTNAEVQWGIVSWGNGCAEANKPGVYTRISYFHEWIRNITNIDF